MASTSTELAGVWTASLTPIRDDLSVDDERLVGHVRWLLDRGSHGAVLLGTTGEGTSFSVHEKIELIENLAESGLPLDRLIVGCGSPALTDAVELARRSDALGFRAVLLLPPYYYKKVSDDGIYDFVRRVIDGVGSADLNVLLYHIPPVAQIGYSIELISRLRTFYPDNVVGMKDSSGDSDALNAFCSELDGFAVFAGTERLLPLSLASGGVGCVSATGNVTCALVRAVYDATLNGGRDPALEEQMLAFRRALETSAMVPALKHLMASRTDSPDWLNVRPPLVALGVDEIDPLEKRLADLPPLPNFES